MDADCKCIKKNFCWKILFMINRQKHYKYLHDRLEIKDIRCIHQGIDREKKDGSHFVSMNVQILNWKKQFSLCTIGKYLHIQRVLIINIHIICMIIT